MRGVAYVQRHVNECHLSKYESRWSKIGLSKEIVDKCNYYQNNPKISDIQVWANNVDSDQAAPDQDIFVLPFCFFWKH